MMLTTVYSKKNCVQCSATMRKLDQLEIEYRIIKVDEDSDALSYTKSLGYLQAPVVVAPDGSHWSGFRLDKIEKLAGRIAA